MHLYHESVSFILTRKAIQKIAYEKYKKIKGTKYNRATSTRRKDRNHYFITNFAGEKGLILIMDNG